MFVLDYSKAKTAIKFTKLLFVIVNITMAVLGCFFPHVLLVFVLNQAALSVLWSAGIVGMKSGPLSHEQNAYIALLLTSAVLTVLAASLVVGLVANPLPFLIVISLVTLVFAIKTDAYFLDSLLPKGVLSTWWDGFMTICSGTTKEAAAETVLVNMAQRVTEDVSIEGWCHVPVL